MRFALQEPPITLPRMEWHRDAYTITDERLDLDATCALVWSTYWAEKRPRDVIERSVKHSLNFALFKNEQQVGYARIVSDRATVAYLCDVVIAPEQRGQGLGRWLVECILAHPELHGCRVDLFTRDAQALYAPLGFGPHRYTSMVRYWPEEDVCQAPRFP